MTYASTHLLRPTHTPGMPLDAPILFFDDFITISTSATVDLAAWFFAATTPVTAPSFVRDDADGGWLSMGTDNVNIGDFALMYVNGESFLVAPGRNMYFETRAKFITAASGTVDAIMGMAVTDDSPFASAPSDYIAFRIVAGSIQFTANDGGSAPAFVDSGLDVATGTTFALATPNVFAWEYSGASGRVKFFVDGNHVGTLTTDIPVGKYLTPTMGVATTVALAEATTAIDYVLAVNDRSA